MRFCSIGSGSKGNGTLIQQGNTTLLIDSGFTVKEIEQRLAHKGLSAADISAVLVTHEHADHIKGVGPLARKYNLPVYLTYGTAQHHSLGVLPQAHIFDPHNRFSIGELEIQPVVVPHDAREPVQYVLTNGREKMGVLTDLGSITPYILACYRGCHGLMLETNHDLIMLQNGPYPPKLKARVASDKGHLSNAQAAEFLALTDKNTLQHVVATHISEQNNQNDLAVQCLSEVLSCDPGWVAIADQESGLAWRDLRA